VARPRPSDEWRDALVVLDQHPDEGLKQLPRSERHAVLLKQTAEQRQAILDVLHDAGLDGEADIADATSFGLLTIRASDRALERIRAAPAVSEVRRVGGALPVDLL
jgi:hypothetical protein